MAEDAAGEGNVAAPLLKTKLHQPARRRDVVHRARLVQRLEDGATAPLTLVCAPAGFGKTTLVMDWLERSLPEGAAVAWLSLDAGDDDPRTFLAYVCAAIERATAPGTTDATRSLLGSPELEVTAVLIELINQLQASTGQVVLVLDDHHVLQHSEVHAALEFLVEHLPPQLRIVITSRADPLLPLARLRARGQLVEVRAAELRFTTDEAATYLTEAMGLELSEPDVAALDRRTEGWAAALQLAALSLRDRTDVEGFIDSFAGDDRYVIDYLADEVLDRQPDDVRRFLLETSILSRLDSSLCAAVTGRTDARALLDLLDRQNLFVVPLDAKRHAYRYHHLFADVLRAHLLDELPDAVAGLHRRAGDWFEQHGERDEAVRHALEGGHSERAAELVERALPDLRRQRQEVTLRRWLDSLPRAIVEDRPVLTLALAGAQMSTGEFGEVDALLATTQRRLDDGRDLVVVDEHEQARAPAQLAMYRSASALMGGDVDTAAEFARHAFELSGPDDHLGRGSNVALLALALWRRGELAEATERYSTSLHELESAGHLSDVLGCTIAIADLLVAQGRLRDASAVCERGLELGTRAGVALRGTADMHVALADLLRERGHAAEANEHLERSDELGPTAALAQNPYRHAVVSARLHAARGEWERAFELLDVAEAVYDGDFSPDVRPIAALRARIWIVGGRPERALEWAARRGLDLDDEPSYLREFEHVTLAAAVVASADHPGSGGGMLTRASAMLDRLVTAARDGGRVGNLLDLLSVRALAHDAGGDRGSARSTLAEALALAEPAGHVRTFLDHGQPKVGLLRTLADDDTAGAAARRVMSHVDGAPAGRPDQAALIDPLSARELDVLRLLRSDLSGPEIARELVVSLNTVRTHTKTIYSKLGVNSRRAAVRRADELGL